MVIVSSNSGSYFHDFLDFAHELPYPLPAAQYFLRGRGGNDIFPEGGGVRMIIISHAGGRVGMITQTNDILVSNRKYSMKVTTTIAQMVKNQLLMMMD